jgi:hypothetical protein
LKNLPKFTFAGGFLKVFLSLEVIMLKRVVLGLLQRVNVRNFQLDSNLIEAGKSVSLIFSNKAAKQRKNKKFFYFRGHKKYLSRAIIPLSCVDFLSVSAPPFISGL